MQNSDRYHLLEAIRNGFAEAAEDEDLSQSLRAETRLRLIRMSDEELWGLLKTLALMVETRGQSDEADNSVGFSPSGLAR